MTSTGSLIAWWYQAVSAPDLTEHQRRKAAAAGIDAADALLADFPDNEDAMFLKAVLLRTLASLADAPGLERSLLADAQRLHLSAAATRKARLAGLL